MEQEVIEMIEKEIKPMLAMDGGSMSFVGIEDGVVSIKMEGACGACPMSTMTLKGVIEESLKKIEGVTEVINV